MRTVRIVPTALTLGNLVCGFCAISIVVSGAAGYASPTLARVPRLGEWLLEVQDRQQLNSLILAGFFIYAAMIFDFLDGRVARMAGLESRFGAELDSLADLVSFGVAPAVIAMGFLALENVPRRFAWPMLAVYVACAGLRLARYNVSKEVTTTQHFRGLPAPAAAGAAVGWVLLWANLRAAHNEFVGFVILALPVVMALLGMLMVSRVAYLHVGERLAAQRRPMREMALALIVIAALIFFYQYAFVVAFNVYVVAGIESWMVSRLRAMRARRRHPA